MRSAATQGRRQAGFAAPSQRNVEEAALVPREPLTPRAVQPRVSRLRREPAVQVSLGKDEGSDRGVGGGVGGCRRERKNRVVGGEACSLFFRGVASG